MMRRHGMLLVLRRGYCSSSRGEVRYVQGQYNKRNPKVREYFYCVDHNGMLFLDDARMKNFTSCFKEKKFLEFFYSRVRRTPEDDEWSAEFGFTSLCGRERNYIRVDATPFVFSALSDHHQQVRMMELNYTGTWREFRPESLYEGSDGRLYHGFQHPDVGFALIRSQLADTLFPKLTYEHDLENQSRPVMFDGVRLDYAIREQVELAIRDQRT